MILTSEEMAGEILFRYIKFINDIEKDFLNNPDKPLLKPKNNREYWLFTEIIQRLYDFKKVLNELEARERANILKNKEI